MEIHKMLTISTAHITFGTAERITEEAYRNRFPILSIYRKEDYGWFIYFDTAELDDMSVAQIPADLMACVNLAAKNGCSILCLDQDGDECDLPQYDWDDEDAVPVEPQAVTENAESSDTAECSSVERISYNRFQWFWLASHNFSVRDLINALAECVCELAECEEVISGDDLSELYESNYLASKNLDIALEELSSTPMTDLFRAIAECANHFLCPDERIDAEELIELFEETGLGQGSLYPCLDEFLEHEFQDATLMRQLLNDQEYAEYLAL